MGLNTGSKLLLKLEDNNFFAMGKKEANKRMTVEDIDIAIEEAVIKNDKY